MIVYRHRMNWVKVMFLFINKIIRNDPAWSGPQVVFGDPWLNHRDLVKMFWINNFVGELIKVTKCDGDLSKFNFKFQ